MISIGHFWTGIEPYLFQGLLRIIALFALRKDWKDYAEVSGRFTRPVRITILASTVAIILLSFFETYTSKREAREREQAAQQKEGESRKQIEVLTEEVRQEREENKHNSDGFRTSFSNLYGKYSDLAAKVQNADLLREIKRTRSELKTTQDKLDQPKAQLTASFWHQRMIGPEDVTKEITVQRRADGSVALDLITVNPGEVTAVKGSMAIRICEGCKFTKEPEGSIRTPGSIDEDREIPFEHTFARSNGDKPQ